MLREEPLINDTRSYLNRTYERLGGNPEAVVEEMRHDALLLQMFIHAEARLLEDVGLSPGSLEATVHMLAEVILSAAAAPERSFAERLDQLQTELEEDLAAIQAQETRDGTERRIAGVLGVLCGSLVVAVDAAAGVGTAGVAAGFAGASVLAGTTLVDRSLDVLQD